MVDRNEPIPFPDAEEHAAPAPEASAADRLREFEDGHFVNDDHPRIADRIERGIGSMFAHPDHGAHRAHHAALEALIAAEKDHQAASAAEDAAHTKLQAAIDAATRTEEAI